MKPEDHPVHDTVLRFITAPRAIQFETLALEVFAHQFECIPAYRRVCERQGKTPATIQQWKEIPPVPMLVFKEVELRCGPAERTFLTTGTTAGAERRGRHALPDLRLYRAAAVAGMKECLFPDVAETRILSLIPSSAERNESSLAQMVSWAMEEFGSSSGSRCFATADGLDFADFAEALRQSEREGAPVCIMTTTGALIRFFDHCRLRAWAFRLPHGSRLMDTGGHKGAPRSMSAHGVLQACWNTFAIPGYFCVNEYGMTELSSQYYDNVIRDRYCGRPTHRAKAGPPWMRTLVLDPGTLREVAPGEAGLLCHFDLANAGTALAVLTEDLGRVVKDGFELVGRIAGAEARGCSLSLADFVS
ncbi:MAG: CoF synthetase [Candidatus Binatia bacterium]